jgi:hypothetical protein
MKSQEVSPVSLRRRAHGSTMDYKYDRTQQSKIENPKSKIPDPLQARAENPAFESPPAP